MAASDGAPPGYSITLRSYEGTRALFAALLASALIAHGHEVFVRQSAAYLDPGFGPPRELTALAAAAAALAGLALARRARLGSEALPPLLALLSVSCTASA